jgi:apolipoprotein N-acyltransferase
MYPFRAVEHRTAVVRAANTGVSAFIAPSGQITRRLAPYERDVMTADVPLRTETTLYTRFGDWVAYLGMAVTAAVLGARALKRATPA